MIAEICFGVGALVGYLVATHMHSIAAAAVKLHLPVPASVTAAAQPPLASGTTS